MISRRTIISLFGLAPIAPKLVDAQLLRGYENDPLLNPFNIRKWDAAAEEDTILIPNDPDLEFKFDGVQNHADS